MVKNYHRCIYYPENLKKTSNLDVSSNVTKSVSYGLELANQVLDKEIEIEIDVDKVANQVSTLANKTVEESKVLPQGTSLN